MFKIHIVPGQLSPGGGGREEGGNEYAWDGKSPRFESDQDLLFRCANFASILLVVIDLRLLFIILLTLTSTFLEFFVSLKNIPRPILVRPIFIGFMT